MVENYSWSKKNHYDNHNVVRVAGSLSFQTWLKSICLSVCLCLNFKCPITLIKIQKRESLNTNQCCLFRSRLLIRWKKSTGRETADERNTNTEQTNFRRQIWAQHCLHLNPKQQTSRINQLTNHQMRRKSQIQFKSKVSSRFHCNILVYILPETVTK